MKPYNPHTEQVELWLDRAPAVHQPQLREMRELILTSHDAMQEFYKYKLPMYSIKKNICFLHVDTKTQLPYIGFMNGKIMQDRFEEMRPYLVGTDQKRVRQFWPGSDPDYEALSLLLAKAIELDI